MDAPWIPVIFRFKCYGADEIEINTMCKQKIDQTDPRSV